MAFIFRREGDRIKHKIHMERMGMSPWIEDFKWRAIDWHYQYYMGPKARGAIMSNQRNARSIQDVYDRRSHGFVQRWSKEQAATAPNSHQRTKHFAWTTCLPRVSPLHRTSNPFCPVTPNRTGWREYVEQKDVRGAVRPKSPKAKQHRIQHIMDPKPKAGKHVVSGTDDTVPIMPTQD
eukprot:TRINITY_DN29957_c0_g1_i1.p1 TRINITY_DN29957_c0_g1~~TRINITY_DN29957_c0_g1_i1.p1  ORF type:complete len:178 (+),score=20.11 TRINITY_DN29957_c0_g1_i1:35-568(+)